MLSETLEQQLTSYQRRVKNRKFAAMIKQWGKVFKRPVIYGRYTYQIYTRGSQYELVRYGVDGEYDTVMIGRFYQCQTMYEQIQYVIDDIRGLADQLQEEMSNDTE